MKTKQSGVSTEVNIDSINNKKAKTHKLNYLSGIFCALALFAGSSQAADLNEQVDCHAKVELPDKDTGILKSGNLNFSWTVMGTPANPQVYTSLFQGPLLLTQTTDDPYFDKRDTAMYFGPMVDSKGKFLGEEADIKRGLRIKTSAPDATLIASGLKWATGSQPEIILSYGPDLQFLLVDKVEFPVVCTPRTPL